MSIPRTTLDSVTARLFRAGPGHKYGYNHLTTWSRFAQMMKPVKAPDGKMHRMMHLGAALNMNDEDDQRCGAGVFFSCFTWGIEENISMWTNYGIPNREAVRINFTKDSIRQWLRDYKSGAIGVYGVTEDGKLEVIEARPEVWMLDVAYWSKYMKRGESHKEKREDPNAGILMYRDNKYVITDPENWREELMSGKYGARAVYFKDSGWSHERETRLALIFEGMKENKYTRIAVDFDGPFGVVDEHFSEQVVRGPWYKDEKFIKVAGHTINECHESLYSDKLRMRSVCNVCPEKNSKNCKCPFKGQR